MNRRFFVLAAAACLMAAPAFAQSRTMTPEEARNAALSGELMIIDIRTPREWRSSGVADVAVPIDMTRRDFTSALYNAIGSTDRQVAFICATGGRSKMLTSVLVRSGMASAIDIPEGMYGSSAGPGWLRRGLPTKPGF